MKEISRRDLLKTGLVSGTALAAMAAMGGCAAKPEEPSQTPGEAAQRVTVDYDAETVALAKVIISTPIHYTDAQLKEVYEIISCKCRYFWGNDFQDFDALKDTFTDEGPDGFQVLMGGKMQTLTPDEQIDRCIWSIGPQENMIPMHFGHNQIVRFLDDTHAQLLTRMNDRHTYKDDGEVYAGWGFYVDDAMKCKDGAWRFSCIRLCYGVLENQLRCVKKMMEENS